MWITLAMTFAAFRPQNGRNLFLKSRGLGGCTNEAGKEQCADKATQGGGRREHALIVSKLNQGGTLRPQVWPASAAGLEKKRNRCGVPSAWLNRIFL